MGWKGLVRNIPTKTFLNKYRGGQSYRQESTVNREFVLSSVCCTVLSVRLS